MSLPFFAFSEPIAAPKLKYCDTEFTLWDRFDIVSDVTLKEFIAFFKTEHGLDVVMISSGVSMLYFAGMPKMEGRLPWK